MLVKYRKIKEGRYCTFQDICNVTKKPHLTVKKYATILKIPVIRISRYHLVEEENAEKLIAALKEGYAALPTRKKV